MNLELTNYFDDLISGWEAANKTAIINLVKRCLIKSIIKKEAFESLLVEVNNWNGRQTWH